MATVNEALRISQYSQDKLVKYTQSTLDVQTRQADYRANLEEKDRIYQRELDWTQEHLRARLANRTGDSSKMQNVTMPVVMPQVEATHGFLVETFLSSYPIFPVVSGPQYLDIAQQIDAVMGESATRFQYARHLAMAFRDGLKYNIMAVECEWKNLKVYTVSNAPAKDVVFGTPVETEFSGNIIKRLDPYNIIVDPRVNISEIHEKGDYAGYTEMLTRIQLKNLFLELDNTLTMNADAAFQSTSGVPVPGATGDVNSPVYVPQVNPSSMRDPAFTGVNWLNWVGIDQNNKKVTHSDMYQVTTLYMRIIPREFGINTGKQQGMNGVPQIFKTIVVNGQVVIYVERKSNAHNYLPIIVGQPIEDGLNYQTKSFADNAAPYQFLASALYNSGIQSQRRKVYDRIIYDPSRINKSDIEKVDPVARIAVKQNAYGKPIGEAYEVMPYRDDGVPNILAMARDITEMADVSTGQNRVQRGQFQKGNKTRGEFETVMDKSDLRPRTMAVLLESGFLQPLKHILKMNILQFQPPAQLYNQTTQQMVEVSPSQLRNVAWQFQVADGVMPVSKILNPELYMQLLQYASAVPQMAAMYDLAGMGIYSLKLQGATWVDAFKYNPQQTAQNAQAIQGPQSDGQPATPPAP
jgi:hypothetical protein